MTLLEDMKRFQETLREMGERVERDGELLSRHEEQISGERGMSQAINALAVEVKGLRKAAYWLAGLIVTSSIGFAFSVLTIFTPGS